MSAPLQAALRALFTQFCANPELADDAVLAALPAAPAEDVLALWRGVDQELVDASPLLRAQFRARLAEAVLGDARTRAQADADQARAVIRAVIHDSSNHLSAVCGNLEFVERLVTQLQPAMAEALQDAAEAGRAMQELMSRTGDLMALEQQRLPAPRWIKVDQFIRLLKLPRGFSVAAPAGLQLLVRDALLARSVRFLCTRAQLAGGAQLSIRGGAGNVSIQVTDQGPAVRPETLALMTSRNWRGETVDGVRAERTHGHHVAALVAQAHGGMCVHSSSVPVGLTVELCLPQPVLQPA